MPSANAHGPKDAIIAGSMVPQAIPDFVDLKFDPGEVLCSTKNVEKDLEILSEVVKNIEIQQNCKFGVEHKKENKMSIKTFEGLEDEFDSTLEAFEDHHVFRDTKVDAKMLLEYREEFDSTKEFLLQIRDSSLVQDTTLG